MLFAMIWYFVSDVLSLSKKILDSYKNFRIYDYLKITQYSASRCVDRSPFKCMHLNKYFSSDMETTFLQFDF